MAALDVLLPHMRAKKKGFVVWHSDSNGFRVNVDIYPRSSAISHPPDMVQNGWRNLSPHGCVLLTVGNWWNIA
eukprot:1434478-Amphidinium_carterae.1